MSHRTSRLWSHEAQQLAGLAARRYHFYRLVLPALIVLLQERAQRSAAPLTGKVLGHLLTSAAANVGIVAVRFDAGTERDWPDARSLTDHLYRDILAQRRHVFGPTRNQVPHGGYAPDQVLTVAERLLQTLPATPPNVPPTGSR